MIGALRYFASRFLAPRYWPKVGAGTVTLFDDTCDRTLGNLTPRRSLATLTAVRTLGNLTPRRTLACLED